MIENSAEMQLQSRIESDTVRNIWNPEKFQQRLVHDTPHQQQSYQNQQQSRIIRPASNLHPVHRHQQQFYCTLQYQPFILRTEYQRRALPSSPILSAEVPEFFPKTNTPPQITYLNSERERRTCQLRYFPSLNERSYQNELFPYNRVQQYDNTITQFPVNK